MWTANVPERNHVGGSRMMQVLKHLGLFRRFVVQAAVRETHYRMNLITATMVALVQIGLGLLPVFVMFEFASEINGWSRAEVVAMSGAYQMVSGILTTFVRPNMMYLGRYIVRGELDGVLLRPVASQFFVTFRWINLAELVHVVIGSALLVAGIALSNARPSIVDIVQAAVLLLCGVVLVTCAWSAAMYLIFWMQRVYPLIMMFQSVLEAGRYPITFFPALVRVLLTCAVPVAFATTFPVQALADGIGWTPVVAGPVLCLVAVWLLRRYWTYVLRLYSSASS